MTSRRPDPRAAGGGRAVAIAMRRRHLSRPGTRSTRDSAGRGGARGPPEERRGGGVGGAACERSGSRGAPARAPGSAQAAAPPVRGHSLRAEPRGSSAGTVSALRERRTVRSARHRR